MAYVPRTTEQIDKLFLELAQFTSTETPRERVANADANRLEKENAKLRGQLRLKSSETEGLRYQIKELEEKAAPVRTCTTHGLAMVQVNGDWLCARCERVAARQEACRAAEQRAYAGNLEKTINNQGGRIKELDERLDKLAEELAEAYDTGWKLYHEKKNKPIPSVPGHPDYHHVLAMRRGWQAAKNQQIVNDAENKLRRETDSLQAQLAQKQQTIDAERSSYHRVADQLNDAKRTIAALKQSLRVMGQSDEQT